MTLARASLLSVFLLAVGCQKTVPANPPVAQVAAPPVAAAPAKMVTMVCRNSQTGAAAECGTPNAVMVGTKEQ